MKFILVPIIVWAVSQTIKFVFCIIKGRGATIQEMWWTYMWAGGAPSSHSAVLVASLYILGINNGFDALFGFAFVIVGLLIYNLLAERRKEQIFEENLKRGSKALSRTIVDDGRLLDISGHTYIDVAIGIVLGFGVAVFLDLVLF